MHDTSPHHLKFQLLTSHEVFECHHAQVKQHANESNHGQRLTTKTAALRKLCTKHTSIWKVHSSPNSPSVSVHVDVESPVLLEELSSTSSPVDCFKPFLQNLQIASKLWPSKLSTSTTCWQRSALTWHDPTTCKRRKPVLLDTVMKYFPCAPPEMTSPSSCFSASWAKASTFPFSTSTSSISSFSVSGSIMLTTPDCSEDFKGTTLWRLRIRCPTNSCLSAKSFTSSRSSPSSYRLPRWKNDSKTSRWSLSTICRDVRRYAFEPTLPMHHRPKKSRSSLAHPILAEAWDITCLGLWPDQNNDIFKGTNSIDWFTRHSPSSNFGVPSPWRTILK